MSNTGEETPQKIKSIAIVEMTRRLTTITIIMVIRTINHRTSHNNVPAEECDSRLTSL